MSTSDKLQRILDTKYDIRKAIGEKGVDIDENTLFSEYADKIREIAGEMSNGEGYPIIMYGRPTSFVINDKAVGLTDCKKIFPFPDIPNIIAYVYFSDEIIRSADFSNNKGLRQVITLDTNFIESITFENCNGLVNIAPSVMTADPSFLLNLDRTFAGCSGLNSINLSSAYYSECKSFSETFSGCTNLKVIYLMEWEYSQVMKLLENSGLPDRVDGEGCIYTTIDDSLLLGDLNGMVPSGWRVFGKVVNEPAVSPDQPSYVNPNFFDWRTDGNTNYDYLFSNSDKTSLDGSGISELDTSNVTSMVNTFNYSDKLTSLDLSNWDVSSVTNMQLMFSSCKALTSLDISNWDVSSVENMSSMFKDCNALTSLDISNWDVSKIRNMYNMFYNCKALTSLDISKWDVSNINVSNTSSNMNYMFQNCTNLVELYPPQNISSSTSCKGSDKLSHDSLMRIINNLTTVSKTQTLTMGTTNLAKLTDDEKLIATEKGWALA